jgi:hypothetical protein
VSTEPARGLAELFPLAERFQRLVRPALRVREPATDAYGFPYSERHLQAVWFDPRWRPRALKTVEGETVQVDDPGRWNLEAGPDFLDAVLRLGAGRRRVRGDVEVHIRPADWERHGHGADPRYARVVAHVCYFPTGLGRTRLPPGAVTLALRDALAANPYFSFACIDSTAYPYAALPAEPPPCGRSLARRAQADRLAVLAAAGQERLRVKALRLQAAARTRGDAETLYEEILSALGYKHNGVAFRELARRAPLARLQEETDGDTLQAYALLLGVSGLLPEQPDPRWDAATRRFVRRLWDAWWTRRERWAPHCMPASAWRLAGLRPQNHPVRRMAVAAGLCGGLAPLRAHLLAPRCDDPADWLRLADLRIGAGLRADTELYGYWTRRLSMGLPPRPSAIRLIGSGRLTVLMLNVLIPYRAAHGLSVAPLLASLPSEPDNAVTREVAHALFGPDGHAPLNCGGLCAQGLLQIFHDFCVPHRADCSSCPFAAALENA